MKFKIGILFVLSLTFVLLWTSSLYADQDLIGRIEKKRSALTSLRVEAKGEIPRENTQGKNQTYSFSVSYCYRSPGRYRSEISMGLAGRMMTICDGSYLYSYDSRQKTAYRQSITQARSDLLRYGATDPTQVLLMPEHKLSEFFNIALKGSERISGRSCYRFSLKPKKGVSSYSEIVAYMDQDSLMPRRIVVMDGADWISRITITSFKENVPVAEKEFRFRLPADAEMMDLPSR